jgi:OOP family OmpA-OmpF porin
MMVRRLLFAVMILGMCTAAAHAGIFVGASVGSSGVDVQDSSVDFSESATGYKAFGGFRIMKFFAVEGGYVDFGSPEGSAGGGTDVKVSATGWDVMGVGTLPLGKHFEIFGKAGFILWDSDVDSSGSGSASDSGNDFMYGAGVAFKFGKHLAVRLEYEQFDVSDIDTVDLTSAGVEFRF